MIAIKDLFFPNKEPIIKFLFPKCLKKSLVYLWPRHNLQIWGKDLNRFIYLNDVFMHRIMFAFAEWIVPYCHRQPTQLWKYSVSAAWSRHRTGAPEHWSISELQLYFTFDGFYSFFIKDLFTNMICCR